jgi:hypothetical protein
MNMQMQTRQKALNSPSIRPVTKGILQRNCDKCHKKKPVLQRSTAWDASGSMHSGTDEMPYSTGQMFYNAARFSKEQQFGHDFSRIPVQRKLTINAPGDKYEQEADRIAEKVIQITGQKTSGGVDFSHGEDSHYSGRSGPIPHEPCRGGGNDQPSFSRQMSIMAKAPYGESCESAPSGDQGEEAEEEEIPIMAKRQSSEQSKSNRLQELRLSLRQGGGSPLPRETRSFMESSFGHDFSAVRVHTDRRAAAMAKQIHAEAFTSGRDIYFREGKYDPQSLSGKRLLAHELTHVIQQGANSLSGRSLTGKSGVGPDHIQRFRLRGFPPAEEAAMKAAVPVAVSKVKSCSKLSWYGKRDIPIALNRVRYDYVPDLGLCGWTFPTSWYIEVGKIAFNSSKCCDLASTLAHEAAHTVFYTESRARKMECNCFGCSC